MQRIGDAVLDGEGHDLGGGIHANHPRRPATSCKHAQHARAAAHVQHRSAAHERRILLQCPPAHRVGYRPTIECLSQGAGVPALARTCMHLCAWCPPASPGECQSTSTSRSTPCPHPWRLLPTCSRAAPSSGVECRLAARASAMLRRHLVQRELRLAAPVGPPVRPNIGGVSERRAQSHSTYSGAHHASW